MLTVGVVVAVAAVKPSMNGSGGCSASAVSGKARTVSSQAAANSGRGDEVMQFSLRLGLFGGRFLATALGSSADLRR